MIKDDIIFCEYRCDQRREYDIQVVEKIVGDVAVTNDGFRVDANTGVEEHKKYGVRTWIVLSSRTRNEFLKVKEYKDAKKVREFAIAIDTSASCRGPIVKAFLRKTYSILKSSENFFRKVNIHIIYIYINHTYSLYSIRMEYYTVLFCNRTYFLNRHNSSYLVVSCHNSYKYGSILNCIFYSLS